MKKIYKYLGIIALVLSLQSCGSSRYGPHNRLTVLNAVSDIAVIIDCTVNRCLIRGNHRHSNIWYRGRYNQYDRQPLPYTHHTYLKNGVSYCYRSCNVPTYYHYYENLRVNNSNYNNHNDYIIRYVYNQRSKYYWAKVVNNRYVPDMSRNQPIYNKGNIVRTHYHQPYVQRRSGRPYLARCNNYCR